MLQYIRHRLFRDIGGHNNRTIALIGITVQQITDIHDPQRCLRVDLIRLCIGAAALLSDSVTIIEILIQPLRCYILLLLSLIHI